ncbi:MspA family porin [Nocardia sp. NPDC057668]|uniref:MspA family porin n=1 Tax=Nocardia sp. NPDC057668 TaxID=3346202 RepID=UPI00366E58D0
MFSKTAIVAAFTALGAAFGMPDSALAYAGPMAPHEKVLEAPGGMITTVGSMNTAFRPVAPMNGMPTDREVYLDNTAYGRIDGGTGKLSTGFFVGCAVDLDVTFDINGNVGINVGASAGVDVDLFGVTPTAGVTITPSIGAGIGFDLGITAGKIQKIDTGTKELSGPDTGYIVNRDYRLAVTGCGGQLTIKPFVIIEATSTATDAADWVIGDPIIL